ncbi:MAG TPA: site-specific DNA-methyltransferase [Solirubrobacterales bacterium]
MKFAVIFDISKIVSETRDAEPILSTPNGALFNEDCVEFLSRVRDESVDTVFADPPFNLGKVYGQKVDDRITEDEYLEWGERWLDQCIRVLKPGGSLFVYNLPRWNMCFGAHLMKSELEFRHWISISMKAGLPIARKLYPAHYSLLYFSKGKPRTFNRIRTPIELCRHCGGEIKDYGGHRGAMNPAGVNLTDVWTDVPPVRHWKFKSKKRGANQLSTKILERVIHLSTREGDLVLDPFGGSGTTFDVAQSHCRFWIGSEIENCDVIIERLESSELHRHSNSDWVEIAA